MALPPIPYRATVLEATGFLTVVWGDWFNDLFLRVGGHAAMTGEWLTSQAASGYQKLPSGLVIQWGVTGATVSGATAAVAFPVAFATACLQVIPSIRDNSAVAVAATGQVGSGGYSATGCSLYNRTSVDQTMNWIAVGY